MAIADNVVTEYVLENGMGGIDAERMATAIEQTKSVYEFVNTPDAALYFDASFLPESGAFALE